LTGPKRVRRKIPRFSGALHQPAENVYRVPAVFSMYSSGMAWLNATRASKPLQWAGAMKSGPMSRMSIRV